MSTVGSGHDLETNVTTLSIVPAAIQPLESVTPLFIQETGAEGDKLDARRIGRTFAVSTSPDVILITDFIPEIIRHSGARNVLFKRIYDVLVDCFDFSGPRPAVIPKMRDVAYLSMRAFAHIARLRVL